MSNIQEFDLIIIGSGSGNSIINEEWDGKKVAIIDGGTFGGTCLNFGCIPTKQYVYPATVATEATHIGRLGVEAEVTHVDWKSMRDRIFKRIDAISHGGLDYRKSLDNVTVFEEYAKFTGTHELETASGKKLRGKQIVIAAGSHNQLPQVPGIDHPAVHTSDTVMRIDELPQRVVVVGGGFIAAEFAHVFNGLGSTVVQANRSETLLRSYDQEIVERFKREAAKQWDLRLNYALASIESNDDGSARVVFEHDSKNLSIDADLVLIATGRTPNSESLNAASFFDLRDSGGIEVDRFHRVLSGGKPVDGVFALGDISSNYLLKHVANAETRTVQHNLVHPDSLRETDERFVPAAVFTYPQIATVGLTEDEARTKATEEGFEIAVKVQNFGDVAYGWAMEDQVGLCKVIARKDTGELLGAHLVGEESSMLIQPLIQAMSFGLTAHEMARGQFWIHPALTEVVENALLGLELEK
ncbi:NADPH-dependent mycothiol reductase Mtr [Mycobacteroides abscessus subsp. abscessus]|nr:NADPH-dependent mycothiol reductase Mtr [Mycobacteroides abscessus subsp. abscessus]